MFHIHDEAEPLRPITSETNGTEINNDGIVCALSSSWEKFPFYGVGPRGPFTTLFLEFCRLLSCENVSGRSSLSCCRCTLSPDWESADTFRESFLIIAMHEIRRQTEGSEELENKLLFLRTGSQFRLKVSAGERGSFGGVIFFPNQGFHRNEGQVVDHEKDQVPVACTRDGGVRWGCSRGGTADCSYRIGRMSHTERRAVNESQLTTQAVEGSSNRQQKKAASSDQTTRIVCIRLLM